MELKLKSKKGLSAVIGTVILIALVLVAISLLWLFVSNMLNEKLSTSASCFSVLDKVHFNREFTCYNSSGNLSVYIEVKDVEIDSIIISIYGSDGSKSYKIEKNNKGDPGVYVMSGNVSIPSKNGGKKYLIDISSENLGAISKIELLPVVSGTQCNPTDIIKNVPLC